jgi:hypothetical protein
LKTHAEIDAFQARNGDICLRRFFDLFLWAGMTRLTSSSHFLALFRLSSSSSSSSSSPFLAKLEGSIQARQSNLVLEDELCA